MNLIKIQFSAKNQSLSTCTESNSISEFDLSLAKIQFSTKKKAGAHVQSQAQFFEFDLSLTKIQFSTKKPRQERMYKVKLNF